MAAINKKLQIKKVKFSGNIFMLGCGSIAQCTLPLLLKHLDVKPSQITIMDFTDKKSRISKELKKGMRYIQKRLNKKNYQKILREQLKAGDIFIDLSYGVDTRALLDWCHKNDVLFVNTAVEHWENVCPSTEDPSIHTLYFKQMELCELTKSWKGKGPTAIIDHGANPGLVSHFTKEALVDIANHLLKHKPKDSRIPGIKMAMKTNNFAKLAQLLDVKTIHISERDTQISDKPKQVREFVNTWSVPGFMEEGVKPAELGWGTHEKRLPVGGLEHKKGPRNQIYLPQRGIKTWVQSWVPSGPITGMVIQHGEAFSISRHLTLFQKGKPVYRPTVHYAYCPCDGAINSLHELEMQHFVPQPNQRILNDEIISGVDELGCLLMGHDFKSWWIGSLLDIDESRRLVPHQNATTLQVAISVVAATVYMIKHPNEGFCAPDDLDYKEILSIAKPYLGKFISKPVDWTPMDHFRDINNFNQKVPPKEDMWQFTTFLIPPQVL